MEVVNEMEKRIRSNECCILWKQIYLKNLKRTTNS